MDSKKGEEAELNTRACDIERLGDLAELLEKEPASNRLVVNQSDEPVAIILGMDEYKTMWAAINRRDKFDEIMGPFLKAPDHKCKRKKPCSPK